MEKTPTTHIQEEWHVLDAKGQVLGRLAVQVAQLLIGKSRLDYLPNRVAPVHVIIINTDLVDVTGDKEKQKMYRWYSGYPGGLKERSLGEQRRRDSRRIVEYAVVGMLPKNSSRDVRMRHLHLYTGAEHPHEAQINQKSETRN